MIPRYTHPEMGAHLERAAPLRDVARGRAGGHRRDGRRRASCRRTPRASCARAAAFDIARIEEIEQTTQHDVIAFTTAVAEHVGPAARWLHFGLTSSDVLDTALALQMREACDLILKGIDGAAGRRSATRAEEHRRTPMIGRTHGVHAEPMTFGLKLALWYAELQRDLERVLRAREVDRRSASSRAPSARSRTSIRRSKRRSAARLGLEPAPVSSQVIQRDRHAELLTALAITAASLEKFALEIRGLQKTEIGEVEEPFAKGQKGSSAMPHKRNPIGCEQIVGLARLLRANAMAALENVALWHERDISHSSVERVILPDSFIALDHMLRRFTRIVARHGGLSGADAREPRAVARRRVLRARCCSSSRAAASRASRPTSGCSATRCASFHEQRDFKALLLADPDVTRGAAAGRDRARRSISTSSSATSTRSSTGCSTGPPSRCRRSESREFGSVPRR